MVGEFLGFPFNRGCRELNQDWLVSLQVFLLISLALGPVGTPFIIVLGNMYQFVSGDDPYIHFFCELACNGRQRHAFSPEIDPAEHHA